jgi:hypothetical protein
MIANTSIQNNFLNGDAESSKANQRKQKLPKDTSPIDKIEDYQGKYISLMVKDV